MTTLITLEIKRTPHPCLAVNNKAHDLATVDRDSTKAQHRATIRHEGYLAMHQAIVADDGIAELLTGHRLRFNWSVYWEPRRKRADDDGLIGGGLKAIRDGIAEMLGIDDVTFKTGDIEQVMFDERPVKSDDDKGSVLVEIVSLGEIERKEPTPIVLAQCQAKTAKGMQCSRMAEERGEGRLSLCTTHLAMLERDGRIALAMDQEAAA